MEATACDRASLCALGEPGDDSGKILPANWDREVRRLANTPEPESRIIVTTERQNPVREQFRYIEHHLRKLRQKKPVKRILVTSAAPREGKTVVASNLAFTLAFSAARVLLIDGDMRGCGRADVLGVGDAKGLADILENRATVLETMIYLEALKTYYIPAGKPSIDPADLVQGERMREFLKTSEEFDWVVLDSPPIGAFADALSLASQVDTVVVVARSGVTQRRDLEESLAALQEYHVAGVVLNAYDQPKRHDYYYSYYDARKGK
jgi:succinoglycan biosynthesis transport protein ExoP